MALSSDLSYADLNAISGNNNDGFGNGNGFWLILLFLIFACGWGGNWGGGFGGGGQVGDNYVLASDMSQLARQIADSTAMTERKLDGVNNGLCSGFYQEAQLINGTNMQIANAQAGLTQALTAQGFETRNAITQDTIANMQGFNGIQSTINTCCCDIKSNIKDVNYNLATQANGITNAINTGFCQTNFNNQQNTRDILENQNTNARAILDAINANKIEALKDRINEQNQMINALNLERSQIEQNNTIINALKPPCPTGAYLVANPNGPLNYAMQTSCGCGC